jgi:hypothetical protein
MISGRLTSVKLHAAKYDLVPRQRRYPRISTHFSLNSSHEINDFRSHVRGA